MSSNTITLSYVPYNLCTILDAQESDLVDNKGVSFVLEAFAELTFDSSRSLEQNSTGKHVASPDSLV